MALDERGLMEAERRRYYPKLAQINKQTRGKALKLARRHSTQRTLTDDEVGSFLRAGFRVNDKTRGIYVHV